MPILPYVFFDGRCEEAIDFYGEAVGAKLEMLMRFKEAPDKSMISPGSEEKIMHAQVKIGDASVLMSDGRCLGKPNFQGFALVVYAKDEAEAGKTFAALSAGGQATMPLSKTFFAKSFGMLTDKFGVGWMVIVPEHGMA